MGLIAGKTGYGACLAVDKNATSDGPLTSDDYILFGIPVEQLDLGWDWLENITRNPGGSSISDRTGITKKDINIQKAIIDPQVQATAMAETNAITQKLEEWGEMGSDPIYFFLIINSVNKTWRDSNGTVNKFLLVKLRSVRAKPIAGNLVELSCRLEDCEN